MTESDDENVGLIKYSGLDVPDGVIDAGSAGSALMGLDEAIRFFNTKQSPELATIAYEIPVRTQSGSWQAVIMGGMGLVGGTFALGYVKKVGEKLAENDFKDVGLKDVFKKSMAAIQDLARLIKHTGRPRAWEQARFVQVDGETLVAIPNDQGDEITLPAEHFKWIKEAPATLLLRMTAIVRAERTLSIAVVREDVLETVTVSESERRFFDVASEETVDGEVLFPELHHGDRVKLEGRVIRGSEASNSFGFEYQGHVVNCVPAQGSVRQYKPALFLRCAIEGQVNRHAKHRFVADHRPTVIVDRVTPLEADTQIGLFTS